MEKEQLIPVDDFCQFHHVELSFIHILEESGLVETIRRNEIRYFYPESLSRMEQLTRLHQELEIHPGDLDVVAGLIDRIESLQHRLNRLQRQISFYERLHREAMSEGTSE